MGAENPNLSQQCKPTMQWVQTLGVTSSPQEIRCSFLADKRAETTTGEERQGLKGKEYSAWQS